MIGQSRLAVMVGLSLLVPSVHDALAAPVCASAGNLGDHWTFFGGTAPFGTLTLAQQSNGVLIGGYVEASGGACPAGTQSSILGKMNTDGTFSFTTTLDHPTANCVNFSATGTVSGTSCSTATLNWVNTTGSSASAVLQHACYNPTGETLPQFLNWGPPATPQEPAQATIAVFSQTLTPNYNWGGRLLGETSPSTPVGVDTCWYANNPLNLPATTTVTGNTITLSGSDYTGSGSPYKDDIGTTEAFVTYWRLLKRVPCGSTVYQQMALNCPTSTPYVTNTDSTGIDSTHVKSGRALQAGGQVTTRLWVAPAALVTAISSMLLGH